MQQKTLGFTSRASRAFGSIDKAFTRAGASLKRLGTVAGAAGLAVGGALAWAGKSGLSFEEAISKVGAVSLKSRDQIADLEQKALELGRTTKFTATESANAMEVMARAGFEQGEILSGIGGIMAAAAAEGAEMAETTSHVSNVLKGMGLQASETGRVADVLALASARTNSTIGSLGESMKNLSPVARQFGISLEDSVGMVALLQDVGLDASEAGTATATMLTKLSKPADGVAKKMEKMGIAFKDANGNMLPPLEVFQSMTEASKKLGGNMDTVAFFADLVGLRGQKAALNLQDLFTSEKGTSLTKELHSATGSAQQMADISMDNTVGSWTLFTSAVDGVRVALFNLVGAELKDTIEATTAWVSANQDLIKSGAKEYIQDIRDGLPTAVKWLKRIGIGIGIFFGLSLAVKAARVAIWGVNAAIWAATTATQAWAVYTGVATAAESANTTALVLGTVAKWGRTAATWAVSAATGAYSAALTIAAMANKRVTIAEVAGTAAKWAKNAATAIATGATWLYTTAMGASATAVGGATAATWSFVPAVWAAMAPLLPITLALGALVGTVWLLIKAWESLKATLGGDAWKTVGKMWDEGTLDIAKANDMVMNEEAKARSRRDAGRSMGGLSERYTREGLDEKVASKKATERASALSSLPSMSDMPMGPDMTEYMRQMSEKHMSGTPGMEAMAQVPGMPTGDTMQGSQGLFGNSDLEALMKNVGDTSGDLSEHVVPSLDRIAQSMAEGPMRTESVVTIRDETGKAEVTKKPSGKGTKMNLEPTADL